MSTVLLSLWLSASLLLFVSLHQQQTAAANTYCLQTFSSSASSPVITRFEGKMNVPIKPVVEPHDVLFLWPGVNPYGGEGGLMQPVLTYGANYGQGNNVWGIANWFSDCPGYCHDPYLPVEEGDTLLFYMQYLETYANGSQHWEMGYSSYNAPKTTHSTFQVYREGGNVASIWATEAEFYLNSSDPRNEAKLPASYYYTWDMQATTAKNEVVKLVWSTHIDDPNGNRVNCQFTAENNAVHFLGTQLTFKPYHDGCPASGGYSRAWNTGCQSYCGCNNLDNTPKIACDYCCAVDSAGNCQRAVGPTSAANEVKKTAKDAYLYANGRSRNDDVHPGGQIPKF